MRKLTKAEELENWLKALKEANKALGNGYGPAYNSNNIFVAIPGIIKDKAFPGKINDKAYFLIVVEKDENGARPVDYYAWFPKSSFVSGFAGWHNDDYDTFIKENHWVKEVWDSLKK